MQVYDAVLSRLTVREYKPDPVPDDVVMKLLEAARLAPSSQNLATMLLRSGSELRDHKAAG